MLSSNGEWRTMLHRTKGGASAVAMMVVRASVNGGSVGCLMGWGVYGKSSLGVETPQL